MEDTEKRLARELEDAAHDVAASAQRVTNLRSELRVAYANNHKRNLELDALHYVWCCGGTSSGVHRWTREELSIEVVRLAVDNTLRLVAWWNNHLTIEEYLLERTEIQPNVGAQVRAIILREAEARRAANRWKAMAKRYRKELKKERRKR